MAKETAPAWLVKRYMKLWDKFKDKTFSFEEAKNALKEDNKFLSVVLSEMKKEGWLSLELNPEDARKRLYKLKSLEEVMKRTAEKAVSIFKTDSKEASSNQINIVTSSTVHGDIKNIKNSEDNKN
jgi:type I restriction enzyme M protein